MTIQNKTLKKHTTPRFFLNYPVVLTVRVGWAALVESAAQETLSEVFRFLYSMTDDVDVAEMTAGALRRTHLSDTPSMRDFGITDMVDEFLIDNSGHHLREAVERTYRHNGFQAARAIIEVWQRFNNEALDVRAESMARDILAEFDAAETLRNHEMCLGAIVAELEQLRQAIDVRIVPVSERLAQLNQRLQTVSATANLQSMASAPRWYEWRRQFNRISGFFSRWNQTVATPFAAALNMTAVLESDLLREQIRLATLEAERAIVAETLDLLRQEQAADGELLGLFAEADRVATLSALRAEATRGYGPPAGEMLLNGRELTLAMTRYLFGDRVDKALTILRRFTETRQTNNALGVIANLDINDVAQFVSDLTSICNDLVAEKISKLTIADALAALLISDETGWLNRLTAAFKNTVAKDFLAQNWMKYITPQTFAATIYAPSLLSETNERLQYVLAQIQQAVHLNFDIKLDTAHRDNLMFYCEFFSVPLEAFRFYDDNKADFETVENLPQFNPHALFKCEEQDKVDS